MAPLFPDLRVQPSAQERPREQSPFERLEIGQASQWDACSEAIQSKRAIRVHSQTRNVERERTSMTSRERLRRRVLEHLVSKPTSNSRDDHASNPNRFRPFNALVAPS